MSGPKVVRIVTREEILEICNGHLARVEAALAEWTRICRRNDCLDENALAAAQSRREELAALLASDRFMELQKAATTEEGFLREDIQTRLAVVAAAQSRARTKQQRNDEVGRSLALRLGERGITADAGLLTELENGDEGAFSRAFELLGSVSTEVHDSLRAQLREGGAEKTYATWLEAQSVAPADPAIEKLGSRIDEMSTLVAGHEIETWRNRLAEATEAESARRDLLIDGLDVETGRALANARVRHEALLELHLLVAEAISAGVEVSAQARSTDGIGTEEIKALTRQTQDALDHFRRDRAADARRSAVLEALSSLGYEVAEGMATSLVQDGSLILRSASRPEYGVELNSVPGGNRMQIKPVAFGVGEAGPDPRRDRDAETIWCGDVQTLGASLAKTGGSLAIERALPIGATPLKRIAIQGQAAQRIETAPQVRSRDLRP